MRSSTLSPGQAENLKSALRYFIETEHRQKDCLING